MLHRINATKSDLLDKILQNPSNQAWKPKTEQLMKDINYQISSDEETRNPIKKKVKQTINSFFQTNITKSGAQKSKVQHLLNGKPNWKPGERPLYMSKMNRNDTSTIFKARTRMLQIKNNYKTKYKDILCRGCKADSET